MKGIRHVSPEKKTGNVKLDEITALAKTVPRVLSETCFLGRAELRMGNFKGKSTAPMKSNQRRKKRYEEI